MNVQYANIFIRSAIDVFEKGLNVRMERRDLVRKTSPAPSLPIAIIVGVTGGICGQIVYAMDESLGYAVTRAMLPNRLPIESKRMVNSALSDFARIITKSAVITLAGGTNVVDLRPPAVVFSSERAVEFLNIPTVALGLISAFGLLEINIALTSATAQASKPFEGSE